MCRYSDFRELLALPQRQLDAVIREVERILRAGWGQARGMTKFSLNP
jgi:hypothetical protein